MSDAELDGFDPAARRAVAFADVEARELGHDRVGTEHLLLGLLSNEDSAAARVLLAAGVTLAATRHKASEAVGAPANPGVVTSGPISRTARADRALGRSVRFSHARKADAVGTEHVLLGVLDVEGTAGQVLRGLGVDIDRLRATLESAGDMVEVTPGEPVIETIPSPTCPACSTLLDDLLVYRRMPATGEQGTRDVVVVSCASCGTALSVFPPAPKAPAAKKR